MRRFFHPLLLSVAVLGAAELSGCGGESTSTNPDVKIAEDAVGVAPKEEKKTVETTRDVTVVKETKVIDNKSGQTISDKVESTPVKIKEETREKTNLDVKVGETKTNATPAPAAPPK